MRTGRNNTLGGFACSRTVSGHARPLAWSVLVVAVLLGPAAAPAVADPCQVQDDGTGTITLPPEGCEYLSPDEVHKIIDGLPPDTTIEFAPIHLDFICNEQSDGLPGCPPPGLCEDPLRTVDCFQSKLELKLTGTGDLQGFYRELTVDVSCKVQTQPRTPNDPVQDFDTEMVILQGQLFGDPDFLQLDIVGGSDFGLPSPGHTTLTRLGPPGSDFQVDSFFDISYRIDFQGRPGGALDGLSGSTTVATPLKMEARGPGCIPQGDDCWSTSPACDGTTSSDFSDDPIPAGFFSTNSEEFAGVIDLHGGGGPVDTTIKRLAPICFDSPLPSTVTIPIEIVQLDLVSCQPITVDEGGGTTSQWDVRVELDGAQSPGSMTVTKEHANGGTFDSDISVTPRYVFTEVGAPTNVKVLNGLPDIIIQSSGSPWTTDETLDQCSQDGFFAGGTDQGCCEEVCHSSFGTAPHEHCTLPPECPECVVPVCEPTPDGSACNPGTCPDPAVEECQPRCVEFDPATGAVLVVDCDCRPTDECHVGLSAAAGGALALAGAGSDPCVVPDDTTGTITLPPPGCEYLSPEEVHQILDGLGGGATIELAAIHKDFICEQGPTGGFPGCPPPGLCEDDGGDLGGKTDCFISSVDLTINGTGTLGTFSRNITLWPVAVQVQTGPRTPGDQVQSFDTKIEFLEGELFGDPDFCTLKITAGTGFGLPSPGQTTLTKLPSGDFVVDSFFDITYQIDYQGCPGSQLDGLGGTTTGTIRMETGGVPDCIGGCPPGQICDRRETVQDNGKILVCCDCIDPPTDCVPEPDGSACVPHDCPDATEVCEPRCMNFDPLTGEIRVSDCDCRSPEECHVAGEVTLPPGAGALLQISPDPCVVPENAAGGTITLPPDGCEYLSPEEVHMIIDGLPTSPPTTIELAPIHTKFICERQPGAGFPDCPLDPTLCEETGGDLGGQVDCFLSDLELDIQGTGALGTFQRQITLQVACQVHTGPRTSGDAVQDFDTKMKFLQGDLFGDPDFDFLSVRAGDGFGLPSPGHTTLTRLGPPGSDFAVDSFFDVFYEIDFQGAPGSVLDGMSGTTTATIRMVTGSAPPTCVGGCPAGSDCVETRSVLADGTIDVCCDCVSVPPRITAWRSVRAHALPVGPRPIPLNPNVTGGAVVSETRNGGIQRVEVDFGVDVSGLIAGIAEAEDLGSGVATPATNQSTTNGGLTLVIEFSPGLPDEACYRIDLTSVISGLTGDPDCLVRGLIGDVNGDQSTNNTDKSWIASLNGHPVLPGNVRFDLNLDGSINNTDKSLVASRNGRGATCP